MMHAKINTALNNRIYDKTERFPSRISSYLHEFYECAAAVPSEWEDMQGHMVRRFQLPVGSFEYIDVENQTKKTGLQANIISVSRCSKLASVPGFTPSSY